MTHVKYPFSKKDALKLLQKKNSELGYRLGKNYWNKGIMTEAVKLALKFGFKKLKFHRIYANLFSKNIASKKIQKNWALGWKAECGKKDGEKINGTMF